MDLTSRNGMYIMHIDDLSRLRSEGLEIRKTIIVYNKTGNENALNKACRLCNDFIRDIDSILGGEQ